MWRIGCMKNTYKKNLINNIKKLVDKVDIVSFDIFDTLLFRCFVHPFDVFGYLEYFFEISGFKKARLDAESLARCNYSYKEEVTLKDIYNLMPEEFRFVEEYEQKLELNVLKPNKQLLEIFNYAKEKGKKIIIISDMYLPKTLLKQALDKNGFVGYDKLFISSEIGVRKSTGNLFKYVLRYLNVCPNKILHIGDNKNSDYKIPKKLGFKAFNYPYVTNLFFKEKNNFRFKQIYEKQIDNCLLSLLIGMQIIKWHNDEIASYWEKLGYSLGGIFIYSYVKFIVDTITKTDATDCLFIARDGYMLSKVFSLFNEIKHIKNQYMYAPRFVRILGLRQGLENPNYFNFFKNSILEHFPQYENYSLTENNLNEFLEKEDIKQFCTQILDQYKNYLTVIKLNGDKAYIVDLGSSSASSQSLLSLLLPNKIVAGFYFVLNKKNNIPAFVYDTSEMPLIFEEFIEFLITEPNTPVVGFKNKKPILKDSNIYDEKNSKCIELLQKGEIAFCKDIKDILNCFEKQIPSDFIKNYMNLFFEFSNQDDFKNLEYISWFYTPDNKKFVSFLEILKNKYNFSKRNNSCFIKKIFRRIFEV